MLGGIYFIEQYIMNVFTSFYSGLEEGMENKQKKVIHDATKIHPRDQQRMSIVDRSNKARHVTFQEEEVEIEVEVYVSITEDEIGTDVRKEKSHKIPKVKMPKNASVIVDDEDVIYLEEKRRKKIKVEHSQKVKANSEDPSENSKESREIITLGAI